MSILPSFVADQVEKRTAASSILEKPKEYGVDFESGLLTGRIVEGKEAVKVWIWFCLKIQRFRYPIYSWNYGADLEQYIGMAGNEEYIQTDSEDEIRQALLVNPYIDEIEDYTAEVTDGRLHITFTAVTKFGNVEVEYTDV